MCDCVCVCVVKGVQGDLLPRPIKWGFAFDSVLTETDEPAKLQTCESVLDPTFPSPSLYITYSCWFKWPGSNIFCTTWLEFIALDVLYLLTSIRRVACRSIEEVGWGAQGCHARVSVAIHARGDRAVAALLGSGAGDIAVRRHAACTPTETYRRWGGNTEKKNSC